MGLPELRILLTMNCVAATWQPFNGRGKEVEYKRLSKSVSIIYSILIPENK